MRNAYKILVKKCEERRLLRRPRLIWQDYINVDFKETGYESVDWNHLAGSCEHSSEPLDSRKDGELLDWLNDYHILHRAGWFYNCLLAELMCMALQDIRDVLHMKDTVQKFIFVIVSGMLQVAQQVLCWIQEMELHMLYQFMKVLQCLIAL
jgi:hypothetical protein